MCQFLNEKKRSFPQRASATAWRRSLLNGTHFVLWDGQLGEGTTVGWRVVGPRRCGGAHGDAGGDGGHLPGVALRSDSWSLRSRVHVALGHGPHADEMLNQTLPELKGRQQQQQTVMFVISPSRWITNSCGPQLEPRLPRWE